MQGNWDPLINHLRQRVDVEGRVTLTIEEIIAMTNTRDQSIRTCGSWRAAQRGGAAYDRLANAGFAIEFTPDERGHQVESVSFSRSSHL